MADTPVREAAPPVAPLTQPQAATPSVFGLLMVATVVVAAAGFGWAAWGYYFGTPWTRDASVRAYTAQVAAEVSGRVVEVAVRDNDAIAKGDLLFRVDRRDYEVAVRRAEASLRQARAQAANARAESERRNRLSDLSVTVEARETYQANAEAAEAAALAAEAALDTARVNLERTEIRSPVSGYVTNLLLQPGTYAAAGQAVMTVIDRDSFWIAAYLEETQLRDIRPGDPAVATLMGYPSRPLQGRVDSLARGIQDANATPGVAGLPNVNPVFTWVRLAQRIPVRIRLDAIPDDMHLAAGMTATVRIAPAAPGERGRMR